MADYPVRTYGQNRDQLRVSTTDQNLDRQVNRTAEYGQDHLGADLDDIVRYQDKSTGTDVDRSGYQEMMTDAEDGDLDAVVVLSIPRICRSISDLERTASRLEEAWRGAAHHQRESYSSTR